VAFVQRLPFEKWTLVLALTENSPLKAPSGSAFLTSLAAILIISPAVKVLASVVSNLQIDAGVAALSNISALNLKLPAGTTMKKAVDSASVVPMVAPVPQSKVNDGSVVPILITSIFPTVLLPQRFSLNAEY